MKFLTICSILKSILIFFYLGFKEHFFQSLKHIEHQKVIKNRSLQKINNVLLMILQKMFIWNIYILPRFLQVPLHVSKFFYLQFKLRNYQNPASVGNCVQLRDMKHYAFARLLMNDSLISNTKQIIMTGLM